MDQDSSLLLRLLNRRQPLLGPINPYLDNPVGTERVGGDVSLTNPTPGVEAPAATIGGVPVSQSGLDSMHDLQGSMALAGTFGGYQGATSVQKFRLNQALTAERKGVPAIDIWHDYGWMRGKDGEWKYEIPDYQSTLKPNLPTKDYGNGAKIDTTGWGLSGNVFPGQPQTIGDVLDHPELFKAYPDLAKTPIRGTNWQERMSGVSGGVYKDGSIGVSNLSPEEARITLLHELQHKIQNKEGFARGGNMAEFLSPDFGSKYETAIQLQNDLDDQIRAANVNPVTFQTAFKAQKQGKSLPNYQAEALRNVEGALGSDFLALYDTHSSYMDKMNAFRSEAFKRYQSLAGEVESRLVEARANDLWPHRVFPFHTTGYPTEPQIVVYKGQKVPLKPVDHDPFSNPTPLPVDHDPFAPSQASISGRGEYPDEITKNLRRAGRTDVSITVDPDPSHVFGRDRAFLTPDGKVLASWPAREITHAEVGGYRNPQLSPKIAPFAQNIYNSVILHSTPEGLMVSNENLMAHGNARWPLQDYLRLFGDKMTSLKGP